MNYIIYDLEATCWEINNPSLVQETIEVGAYRLNPYGEILGEYNRFVKPKLNPFLSSYCRDLTSITQHDVDWAMAFPQVIEEFQDWIGVEEEDYYLCSWGSFDRKQLVNDCKLHDMEFEWVEENHINLKRQYQDINRIHRSCGMLNALKREGFEYTGVQHRGISDAENLIKIFNQYLGEWRT